jgi:hypothetical protein
MVPDRAMALVLRLHDGGCHVKDNPLRVQPTGSTQTYDGWRRFRKRRHPSSNCTHHGLSALGAPISLFAATPYKQAQKGQA